MTRQRAGDVGVDGVALDVQVFRDEAERRRRRRRDAAGSQRRSRDDEWRRVSMWPARVVVRDVVLTTVVLLGGLCRRQLDRFRRNFGERKGEYIVGVVGLTGTPNTPKHTPFKLRRIQCVLTFIRISSFKNLEAAAFGKSNLRICLTLASKCRFLSAFLGGKGSFLCVINYCFL